MGTLPTLPALPGQGWSVHRTPSWASKTIAYVSGREARAPSYQYPIWKFELTFDGLDVGSAYRNLRSQTLQQLMGFYLSRQGQESDFIYVDPDFNSVTNWPVATGDGTTTAFQLTRTVGSYSEPLSFLRSISGVTVAGVPATGLWTVNASNQLVFTTAPAMGAAIAATFTFGFICRFSDDIEDFEEIASKLYVLQSLKFESVRRLQAFELLPPLIFGPGPPAGWKVFFITDTTIAAYTMPPDFTAVNTVEGIGGGGGGGSFNTSNVTGPGGSGGAYAIAVNVPVTAGQSVPVQVGKGGAGRPGGGNGRGFDATSTYFGATGSPYMKAQGGFGTTPSGINLGPSKTALAASCIPSLHAQSGGDGGENNFTSLDGGGGSGGGGAAGPLGVGGAGAEGTGLGAIGGQGGGAASGGANGASSTSGTGATGGPSPAGAAGGAGGTIGTSTSIVDGKSSIIGAGGGGGYGAVSGSGNINGDGGDGSSLGYWVQTADGAVAGPGGGGGGGGINNDFSFGGQGGDGGLYGGGGAGGYNTSPGGNGAQGIIVVSYQPL